MVVTALFKAKTGKAKELLALLEKTARASWAEPGVTAYAVHQVNGGTDVFFNVEVYQSQAAFKTHLDTPHVKAIILALDDLLAEPAQILQMNNIFPGISAKSDL